MPAEFSNDASLVGCWRVEATDMIEGRTVSLIGGLPGEYVEFTDDGRYRVDLLDRRPSEGPFERVRSDFGPGLNFWIEGLESLITRCLYEIDGDSLTICIAGDYGPRPVAVRRDDDKLWCVKTFRRCERPRRRRK
ncbi:hypothetical protein [Alienimonas californiensis]|uniref:Lipocalin-like domain-containing protein n=1 Tax=Alienimonas californiensis TaxID=2527989 RepID=A0A517P5B4_9PLAN|nr:hypothetical protein [Alienimonas californiensis]QDT14567.1 hypothetical protein CA12_06420 [Alienimonas californiensis]